MKDIMDSLDNIIEKFNTEADNLKDKKPLFKYSSDGELIEDQPHEPKPNVLDSVTYSYTYTGEHYDTIPRDEHWTKQFASTELAVNITSVISEAVRDGLDNSDVAVVLGKILNEVKQRQ